MVHTTFLHGSRGTVQNKPVLTQLLLKGEKRGTEMQVTSRRPCKRFASGWHPQLPLCVLSCLPRASSTDLLCARCSLSLQFQRPGKAAALGLCPQVSRNQIYFLFSENPRVAGLGSPTPVGPSSPKNRAESPVRKSAMAGRPRHVREMVPSFQDRLPCLHSHESSYSYVKALTTFSLQETAGRACD